MILNESLILLKIPGTMKIILLLTTFTALGLLVNSCARNPVTGKREVVLMSEAQEIAMGKEADPQIIAQFGLYNDSALQNFITAKGNQMAAISHRNNIKYEFKVVDSDVLNAFATPGGYVYFTRGIMAHFNNEAEFAGVLGHELGHITARHSVAQQRNQLLGQLGLITSIIIQPELAQFAEQASQGLGLLFLKFGRDAERQSDKLGVEYSSRIGYDAQQMAGFFKTLERKSAESGSAELPSFLSTHPSPGDRFVTVGKLATHWKQQLNLTNPLVNRNSYLKRIEGLIFGEDPQQGYLENNVFYHPVLKFQFPVPAAWAYQNSPQSVQMAPKDGKALMMMTLVQGQSLQEAASNALKQFNLQAGSSENVTVNGLNAIAMVADQVPQQQGQQQQQQQQQQAVRTLSYVIQHGQNYYWIVGVTSPADFNNYATYFNSTMQGFKVLTDASKINRKPERVRIKTTTKAGTLDQVLRQFNIADKRLEEMAILNGMALPDQVPVGTMIKVIQQ
jgi:predicted Zn-dependent protease